MASNNSDSGYGGSQGSNSGSSSQDFHSAASNFSSNVPSDNEGSQDEGCEAALARALAERDQARDERDLRAAELAEEDVEHAYELGFQREQVAIAVRENAQLRIERDQLQVERDEQEQIANNRQGAIERAILVGDEGIVAEQQRLQQDLDDLAFERDAFEQERDAARIERDQARAQVDEDCPEQLRQVRAELERLRQQMLDDPAPAYESPTQEQRDAEALFEPAEQALRRSRVDQVRLARELEEAAEHLAITNGERDLARNEARTLAELNIAQTQELEDAVELARMRGAERDEANAGLRRNVVDADCPEELQRTILLLAGAENELSDVREELEVAESAVRRITALRDEAIRNMDRLLAANADLERAAIKRPQTQGQPINDGGQDCPEQLRRALQQLTSMEENFNGAVAERNDAEAQLRRAQVERDQVQTTLDQVWAANAQMERVAIAQQAAQQPPPGGDPECPEGLAEALRELRAQAATLRDTAAERDRARADAELLQIEVRELTVRLAQAELQLEITRVALDTALAERTDAQAECDQAVAEIVNLTGERDRALVELEMFEGLGRGEEDINRDEDVQEEVARLRVQMIHSVRDANYLPLLRQELEDCQGALQLERQRIRDNAPSPSSSSSSSPDEVPEELSAGSHESPERLQLSPREVLRRARAEAGQRAREEARYLAELKKQQVAKKSKAAESSRKRKAPEPAPAGRRSPRSTRNPNPAYIDDNDSSSSSNEALVEISRPKKRNKRT